MKSNRSGMEPRIVVVYGGVGAEREVSLVSGTAVLDGLIDQGLNASGVRIDSAVIPAGIDGEGDVVFPVLHGEFGEDGRFQGLLEAAGVEFAGSDSRSSAVCMDKVITKERVLALGVSCAPSVAWDGIAGLDADDLVHRIGPEIVAKPRAMGSSVGLHILADAADLKCFLGKGDPIVSSGWILERRIRGREFSVGVLDGLPMEVVEIVLPDQSPYDYNKKYQANVTRYEVPALLDEGTRVRIKRDAASAFQVCGCRDFARVDFMLDDDMESPVFLEINTLPGMTPKSLLPKSASGVGLGFGDLVVRMVNPALERFRNRTNRG